MTEDEADAQRAKNQALFDKVLAHARRQKVRSTLFYGSDEYGAMRGSNDCQCFTGSLIPDELYHPAMERRPFDEKFLEAFPRVKALGYQISLMRSFQRAHDIAPPEEWECRLELLAINFGLKYKPLATAAAEPERLAA